MLAGAAGHGRCTYRGYSRFPLSSTPSPSYQVEKDTVFVDSQRYGIDVFRAIPQDAPVIVAEAVWQYSHHVLGGLYHHHGPVLTVANWSGDGQAWLDVELERVSYKAGIRYDTLWSADFRDEYFLSRLQSWLQAIASTRRVPVKALGARPCLACRKSSATTVAEELTSSKAILGIFDEGCMGMYNAIIPDELLHPMGIFKERLSQSALYAAMRRVSLEEAQGVRDWLDRKGMKFRTVPARTLNSPTLRFLNSANVCRRAANRRRVWLRGDRHSISARLKTNARFRPRRGGC